MAFFFGKKEPAANRANRKLVVNKNRCPQNHPCPSVRVCPVKALTQVGFRAPAANQEECIRCGKCVKYCPMGAITLE